MWIVICIIITQLNRSYGRILSESNRISIKPTKSYGIPELEPTVELLVVDFDRI